MGVDKPYYLEPGYESEVGGGQLSEQRSAEYNDNLPVLQDLEQEFESS